MLALIWASMSSVTQGSCQVGGLRVGNRAEHTDGGPSAVEQLEGPAEEGVREFGVAVGGGEQAGVLALEVPPRGVGGEQDAVGAHPPATDLGDQPSRGEPDGPTGV